MIFISDFVYDPFYLTATLSWSLSPGPCPLVLLRQSCSISSIVKTSCLLTWGIVFIEYHKGCWCGSSFPDLWTTKAQLMSVWESDTSLHWFYSLQACLPSSFPSTHEGTSRKNIAYNHYIFQSTESKLELPGITDPFLTKKLHFQRK